MDRVSMWLSSNTAQLALAWIVCHPVLHNSTLRKNEGLWGCQRGCEEGWLDEQRGSDSKGYNHAQPSHAGHAFSSRNRLLGTSPAHHKLEDVGVPARPQDADFPGKARVPQMPCCAAAALEHLLGWGRRRGS